MNGKLVLHSVIILVLIFQSQAQFISILSGSFTASSEFNFTWMGGTGDKAIYSAKVMYTGKWTFTFVDKGVSPWQAILVEIDFMAPGGLTYEIHATGQITDFDIAPNGPLNLPPNYNYVSIYTVNTDYINYDINVKSMFKDQSGFKAWTDDLSPMSSSTSDVIYGTQVVQSPQDSTIFIVFWSDSSGTVTEAHNRALKYQCTPFCAFPFTLKYYFFPQGGDYTFMGTYDKLGLKAIPAVATGTSTYDFGAVWYERQSATVTLYTIKWSFAAAALPVMSDYDLNNGTTITNNYLNPSMCQLTSGNLNIVVAFQVEEGDMNIYFNMINISGNSFSNTVFSSHIPILTGSTASTFDEINPFVICHSRGDFVIAYEANQNTSGTGVGQDIYAIPVFNDGTVLGNPVMVNSITTGNQTNPIGLDGTGNGIVVAWTSDDLGYKNGYYRQLYIQLCYDFTMYYNVYDFNPIYFTSYGSSTVITAKILSPLDIYVSAAGVLWGYEGVHDTFTYKKTVLPVAPSTYKTYTVLYKGGGNYSTTDPFTGCVITLYSCWQTCTSCDMTGTSVDHNCTGCATSYYPFAPQTTNCYKVGDTEITSYYRSPTPYTAATQWEQCDLSCQTCSDTGGPTKLCITCATGYSPRCTQAAFVQGTCAITDHLCYPDNVYTLGYYFATNKYIQCDTACLDCTNMADTSHRYCTTCKNASYWPVNDIGFEDNCFHKTTEINISSTAMVVSPYTAAIPSSIGYYPNGTTSMYELCDTNCSKCSGIYTATNQKCLLCATNHVFKNGDAFPNCYPIGTPILYYFLDTSVSPNIFNNCLTNCDYCVNAGLPGGHQCTSCRVGTTSANTYYPESPAVVPFNCWLSSGAAPYTDNMYFDLVSLMWMNCSSLVPPMCTTCYMDPTTHNVLCNTCNTGYYFKQVSDGYCYNTAPNTPGVPGYYLNTNVWSVCYLSCGTCAASGNSTAHNCSTCLTGYVKRSSQPSMCHKPVELFDYWYYNSTNNQFEPCNSACQRCLDQAPRDHTVCIQCNTSPIYYQLELPSYPLSCYNVPFLSTYWLDIPNGVYKKCYLSCDKCDTSGTGTAASHNCDLCASGGFYPLAEDSTMCYNSRPPKRYLTASTWALCYSSCDNCASLGNPTNNLCTTCYTGFSPVFPGIAPMNCLPIPPGLGPGYYYNGSTWIPCYQSCATCSAGGTPSANNCDTCNPGSIGPPVVPQYYPRQDDTKMCDIQSTIISNYYFNVSQFSRCYLSCESCQLGGFGDTFDHRCDNCRISPKYYPLFDQPNMCYLDTDHINTYIFKVSQFVKCNTSCFTCSDVLNGDEQNCITCDTSYYPLLNKKSQCFLSTDNVPGYFYNPSTMQFEYCHETCKTCNLMGDDTNHYCLSCADNYFPLNDNTTQCFKSSKQIDKYIFDEDSGSFIRCHPACFTCSAPGTDSQMNCKLCDVNNDYFPVEQNDTQCYPKGTTMEGYYLDDTQKMFKHCYTSCITCFGHGDPRDPNCKICRPDYDCSPCSLLYYDGKCRKDCPSDMVIDTVGLTCIDCASQGYYKNDNQCIPDCPEQFIPVKKVCTSCASLGMIWDDNDCKTRCPAGTTTIDGICITNSQKTQEKTIITAISAKECTPSFCFNGGTCKVSFGVATCKCQAAFTGANCQLPNNSVTAKDLLGLLDGFPVPMTTPDFLRLRDIMALLRNNLNLLTPAVADKLNTLASI
jgi:hypothetical protein